MHINETNGNARIGLDPRFGTSRPAAAVSQQPASQQFDSVFLSAEAKRAAAIEPMPASVWAEVEKASELADQLEARGQQVRFDKDETTGRITAALYDNSGREIQPLLLTDLVPDPFAGEASAN